MPPLEAGYEPVEISMISGSAFPVFGMRYVIRYVPCTGQAVSMKWKAVLEICWEDTPSPGDNHSDLTSAWSIWLSLRLADQAQDVEKA